MDEFKSRDGLFSYFEDYSCNRKDNIDSSKTTQPLLKSYVIETYRSPDAPQEDLQIFSETQGISELKQIDESLYMAYVSSFRCYIEKINDRFWTIYTTEKSSRIDSPIEKLIKQSVKLDNLWISGMLFNSLWDNLLLGHEPHRFIKMSFEYEDLFYSLRNSDHEAIDEEDVYDDGKRISRINITEQKDVIEAKLFALQSLLPSFHSTSLIRFPANKGSGGHDFYYSGKVTNRSSSFFDHRCQIITLCDIYKDITCNIEDQVWFGVEKNSIKVGGEGYTVTGTPVSIIFNKELSQVKYDNFIVTTFERCRGPFRLWGQPIRLSDKLSHVYGLDMHLWQEIYIEMSPKQFTVILPKGTCGNTIHRLVTNIQRYLEPDISVYVGNENYKDINIRAIGRDRIGETD